MSRRQWGVSRKEEAVSKLSLDLITEEKVIKVLEFRVEKFIGRKRFTSTGCC